jgi:hypothetical protein
MVYLVIGCRCLIAVVFLSSAVSKIRNRRVYAEFVAATARFAPTWLPRLLTRYEIGTAVGIRRVSAGVLGAELAIPVLLAVPATIPVGFAVAVVLLTGFTAAIGAALFRGERVACRCFATSVAPVGAPHLVRNLLLLIVTLTGLALPMVGSTAPVGVLLTVLAAMIAATLVMFTDDLVELFR